MDEASGVTISTIKNLQEKYGISPSKALGQNFLIDPNIANKIVNLLGDDNVIEIGPGLGSLTVALARSREKVIAIDYDKYIIDPLKDVLNSFGLLDKVEIINDDIMKVDIESLAYSNKISSIVGNLPYNISAPLIADISRYVPSIDKLVVMVQKEVGIRLAAPQSTRDVSSISLKCQYFMDVNIRFSVPPQSFIPKPKVDSLVVELNRKPVNSSTNIDKLFGIIDCAFSQRRKMLRQSLKPVLGNQAEQIIANSGIDPTLRAEQCTIDDFIKMHNQVNSI